MTEKGGVSDKKRKKTHYGVLAESFVMLSSNSTKVNLSLIFLKLVPYRIEANDD